MAVLQLIDLGFQNKNRSGTQLSGASNIVNSGNAISLDTMKVILTQANNIDITPQPGNYASVEANFTGVDNPILKLSIVLDKKVSGDQTILQYIVGIQGGNVGLINSKGIKALVISGTGDTKKTIVEVLGDTNTSFHSTEITSGLPTFLGFIKNLSVNDDPTGNFWRVKFDFISTLS